MRVESARKGEASRKRIAAMQVEEGNKDAFLRSAFLRSLTVGEASGEMRKGG